MAKDMYPKLIAARQAADYIKKCLNFTNSHPLGIILGTGWNKAIKRNGLAIPLSDIPGFSSLPLLAGHERVVSYEQIGGQDAICLYGRIHTYEGFYNQSIHDMIRLQTEMLIAAGVKDLIITAGASSLPTPGQPEIKVGDVVVVDNVITSFAPRWLFLGPNDYFSSPNDALNIQLRHLAMHTSLAAPHSLHSKLYVMLPGPYFEGLGDKLLLSRLGE